MQYLANARLDFVVSQPDFVDLTLELPEESVILKNNTGFDLLVWLADRRLEDRKAGNVEHHCGWVRPQDAAQSCAWTPEHLNVVVHRLRRLFSGHLADGERIIERSRGRLLRIGIGEITIRHV